MKKLDDIIVIIVCSLATLYSFAVGEMGLVFLFLPALCYSIFHSIPYIQKGRNKITLNNEKGDWLIGEEKNENDL